jgi:hypothetical protein
MFCQIELEYSVIITTATAGAAIISGIVRTVMYATFIMKYTAVTRGTAIMILRGILLK